MKARTIKEIIEDIEKKKVRLTVKCPYCGIDIPVVHDGFRITAEWCCPVRDCRKIFVFTQKGQVSTLDWEKKSESMTLYYMTYCALNFDHGLLYGENCQRNDVKYLTVCNHAHPAGKNVSHQWLVFSEKKASLEKIKGQHNFSPIKKIEVSEYPGTNESFWKEAIKN